MSKRSRNSKRIDWLGFDKERPEAGPYIDNRGLQGLEGAYGLALSWSVTPDPHTLTEQNVDGYFQIEAAGKRRKTKLYKANGGSLFLPTVATHLRSSEPCFATTKLFFFSTRHKSTSCYLFSTGSDLTLKQQHDLDFAPSRQIAIF